MKVYVIAQLTIRDRERYARYVEGFLPILEKYKGQLLAVDDGAEVLEGAWGHQRVVLMVFDERHDFERWSTSDEYREISQDRLASTDAVVLLVHGLPPRR
jgi:uncharacterized protein (DUF1330 family)